MWNKKKILNLLFSVPEDNCFYKCGVLKKSWYSFQFIAHLWLDFAELMKTNEQTKKQFGKVAGLLI